MMIPIILFKRKCYVNINPIINNKAIGIPTNKDALLI